MFRPKWKKEAHVLYKGGKKFLAYKKDLLKPDRIEEIESRLADLKASMRGNDRERTAEASKQLRATCEGALPYFPQQTWWEENLEVIWVAFVIALGLRTYFIQPFRIPTGSMQPTLNGIIIESRPAEEKTPWFGQRVSDFVLHGRSYFDETAKADVSPVGIRDRSFLFVTGTEVLFSDGSKLRLPSAEAEVVRHFRLSPAHRSASGAQPGYKPVSGPTIAKGQSILHGWIDRGDLVLVDRVSYHFRRPKRGEVFVFDTRGIPTHGPIADQSGGSHYIKRLCGVPGDTIQVNQPDLLVNGLVAREPGIRRVAASEGIYGEDGRRGYVFADNASGHRNPLSGPEAKLELKDNVIPQLREYAALGDNSIRSLDSRYWGPVHEYNLVGPGLFSLWPFSTGHWGFID